MANSMQTEIALCIRCYHIYQTIWQAALGETFDCIRETHNSKDRYAVSVINVRCSICSCSIYSCYKKNRGSILRCFVTPRKLESHESFWNYGIHKKCINIRLNKFSIIQKSANSISTQ